MSRISPNLSGWASTLALLTILSSTGCLITSPRRPADLSKLTDEAQTSAKCTVVLQPARGKPDVVEMPLTEGASVQSALEFTKAARRFRRMDIHVLRLPPSQGGAPAEIQKMNVKYDRSQRMVDVLHDYTLHPSDRVVIKEDPSTIIDDMVQGIAGKMGIPILGQFLN